MGSVALGRCLEQWIKALGTYPAKSKHDSNFVFTIFWRKNWLVESLQVFLLTRVLLKDCTHHQTTRTFYTWKRPGQERTQTHVALFHPQAHEHYCLQSTPCFFFMPDSYSLSLSLSLSLTHKPTYTYSSLPSRNIRCFFLPKNCIFSECLYL